MSHDDGHRPGAGDRGELRDDRSRAIACRAKGDYTLWIRYADGLEGKVYLGTLLELGAFASWRDVGAFMGARPDEQGVTIEWPGAGVRLDSGVLRADLEARGARPRRPIDHDPDFARFMERAVRLAAESLLVEERFNRAMKALRERPLRGRGKRARATLKRERKGK